MSLGLRSPYRSGKMKYAYWIGVFLMTYFYIIEPTQNLHNTLKT